MSYLQDWVKEWADIMQPDKVYWMDGTQEEAERLVKISETEEKIEDRPVLKKLNEKEFPNSYYHRSNPTDVARTEHLTFVATPTKEEAGPNNNWMAPEEAKAKMIDLYKGCMKGRTMYVVPFLMGDAKSPYAKNCVEITDSVYVALSMRVMTRTGKVAIDRIGESKDFFKGIHSIGDLNPERRFIMHFPQDNTVMSFGSGYGGNALLGKKCYALRIASYLGKKEGWLAEHMIIIGVQAPDGKITYFLGAFPSACGKTNLALLNPVFEGYKVWTLGDDIAWINIGEDGQMYAINPEAGMFGVAPGTGNNTNPTMIATLKNDKFFPTLFTNTGIDEDKNAPVWEGYGEGAKNVTDWQGKKQDAPNVKTAAHGNSRFTVSIFNCPTLSPEINNPMGVPISGIIFGGRRKDTVPLVFEARDWESGVLAAAMVGSETTAAATGAQGVVRRDPMAMLPFCGYNMGDYFKHWIDFGKKAKKLPKIFMVNWFLKDENGKFAWPGFRDNSRIIKWMMERIEGKVGANETALGYMPKPEDLDLTGLDMSKEDVAKLLKVDKNDWKAEVASAEEFFAKFGDRIPKDFAEKLSNIKKSLGI
jgi:phosphoenolpyruvate carboxykinase (GTP)